MAMGVAAGCIAKLCTPAAPIGGTGTTPALATATTNEPVRSKQTKEAPVTVVPPALGSIKAGKSYYGEVQVLATEYVTAYGPSKTPRVKTSAPTSLNTRSNARATESGRVSSEANPW